MNDNIFWRCLFFMILASCLACSPSSGVVNILKKDLDLRGTVEPHQRIANVQNFHGIKHWISDHPVVSVMLVPGMRLKKWHNYNELIVNIIDSLNVEGYQFQLTNFDVVEADFQPDNSCMGTRELTIMRFAHSGPSPKALVFYMVNWTTITQATKAKLDSYDRQMNEERHNQATSVQRSFLADHLKYKYFVDIFADLALYRQADYRGAIQASVMEALHTIPSGELENPIVFITGSMGSEVVIDALSNYEKLNQQSVLKLAVADFRSKLETGDSFQTKKDIERELIASLQSQGGNWIDSAAVYPYYRNEIQSILKKISSLYFGPIVRGTNLEEIVDYLWLEESKCETHCQKEAEFLKSCTRSLKQIFMLNNHLVFTSILDYSVDDQLDALSLSDKVIEKLDFITNRVGEEVRIVSFYDPNDLFGFKIPEGKQLINIPISHATRWTVDARRLKRDYLYRLPLGDLRDKLAYGIGNRERLNVLTNLEEPSESAKTNEGAISYILSGNPNSYKGSDPQGHNNNQPSSGFKDGKLNQSPQIDTVKKDGIKWLVDPPLEREKNTKLLRIATIARKVGKLIHPVELPHTVPPNISIQGIEDCIRKHDTTYILTVHGMGSKDTDHFDEMSHNLAKRLGFVALDGDHEILSKKTENKKIPYGIRVLTYTNSEGKFLVFTIVHWSPISKRIKRELDSLHWEAAKDTLLDLQDRSTIHRLLKEKIIIDGFVDVNMALGKGGFLEQMQEAVNQGMNYIRTQRKNHHSGKNIVLISGSLGSKILYDHITHSLDKTQQGEINLTTRHIMEKTARWYMLTNQIPMIGLKELDHDRREKEYQAQVWQAMEQLYADGVLKTNGLEIVSFHDPNDVLTFMLPQIDPAYHSHIKVINLPLRTVGGYEMNLLKTYKFVKKVDKKLFRKLKIESRKTKSQIKKERRKAVLAEIQLLNQVPSSQISQQSDSIIQLRLKELEAEKTLLKKRQNTPLFIPRLLEIIEMDKRQNSPITKKVNQNIVLRFDKAHDQVKDNGHILNVMAFGTPAYRGESLIVEKGKR